MGAYCTHIVRVLVPDTGMFYKLEYPCFRVKMVGSRRNSTQTISKKENPTIDY